MVLIFNRGSLPDYLHKCAVEAAEWVAKLSENEVLERSVGDLVAEAVARAHFEPVAIGEEPVDGGVDLTTIDMPDAFDRGRPTKADATAVSGIWEFTGSRDLFGYETSTHTMSSFAAKVDASTIELSVTFVGRDVQPDQARSALTNAVEPIRTMIGYANADVVPHNAKLEATMMAAVERRKAEVRGRRGLADGLGFPLQRQAAAPQPVPLQRKPLTINPPSRSSSRTFADEPELADAQFNEALGVVCSTLLAMERTPSVASGKGEEDLRDQILVQLNGTFQTGGATGESFLQKGKTDILLSDGERHVLVGECKWWTGQSDCSKAIDQLLGYLTWRNVKATLILFIDRKDATAIIRKADDTVRGHPAFKRLGPRSTEPDRRLNYVLGHRDDMAREIQLAVLFAVLPKD